MSGVSANPILYLSQLALLYVTAETVVNRLMWQISRAILLFNPIIPHQKGHMEKTQMKGENREGWER